MSTGMLAFRTTAARAEKRQHPTFRRKTILLVDDNELVRSATAKILERCGYVVLEADVGHTALTLAEAFRIDVVVMDVCMPGIHGLRVAELLRKTWPSLGVVFISGYPIEDAVECGIPVDSGFLLKPFSVCDLKASIATALHSGVAEQLGA
jgi:CheY-like chemotaxis protein